MLQINPDLPIQLATIEVDDLNVTTEKTAYARLMACAHNYHRRYTEQGQTSVGSVPDAQWARALFRAIGVDPTKRRPSSEALLNRALKGKELYTVNTLVDVGNWCSLDFLLPIGIYDLSKVVGQMTVRIGHEGDVYTGIHGRDVNLAGRFLIADTQGAFGSPITDSQRTSIDESTTHALLVIYTPQDYDPALLQQHATTFADRTIEICGGRVVPTN